MIKPTADYVLLRKRETPEVGPGVIVYPHPSEHFDVVAVGPGRISEHGVLLPMAIKVGDVVMADTDHRQLRVDGEWYGLVHQDQILGVVETVVKSELVGAVVDLGNGVQRQIA